MSVIGSLVQPNAQLAGVQPGLATATSIGGGEMAGSAGPGQAAVGGVLPQQSGLKTILTSALAGGVLGGGLGAAIGLLPAGFLGPVGALSVPFGALIGAGAGALLGAVRGIAKMKKDRQLALQMSPGAGLNPLATQMAGQAGTDTRSFTLGQKHARVRYTQTALKRLGLYAGVPTGKLDKKTSKAIANYEILKGLAPSGVSTPEIRSALQYDLSAIRQFKSGA